MAQLLVEHPLELEEVKDNSIESRLMQNKLITMRATWGFMFVGSKNATGKSATVAFWLESSTIPYKTTEWPKSAYSLHKDR